MGDKRSKILYLEILRIVAILGVVFNHTGGMEAFASVPLGSKRFFLYTVLSLLCKTGVPLFFMISGVLLIGKAQNNKRWLLKHIIRYVVLLLLITLLYVLYKRLRWGGEVYSLKNYMIFVYEGRGLSAHLWFLYAYLSFLISLPVIEAITNNISKDLFVYIILIYLFFKVISTLQYVLANDQYVLKGDIVPSWMLSDIFLYPMVGFCIDRYGEVIEKKIKILFGVLAVCALFSNVYMIYIMAVRNNGTYDGFTSVQRFHNHFVLIFAIAIFAVVKKLGNYIAPKLRTIIIKAGSATFGVYIIHIIIKDTRLMLQWLNVLSEKMDYICAILIYVFTVWLISTVLIIIYKTFKNKIIMIVRNAICKS